MKFRDYLPLFLGAIAIGIAVAQKVHPFGNPVPPSVLIVIAALLVLRFVLQKQLQKRNKLLKQVPRHPLGLSDDRD